MLSVEDEVLLRDEAMAWLTVRTNDGADAVTRDELTQFVFRDQRLTLVDAGRGIRKPRDCQAALSIMTVHTPQGRLRPYEDVLGPDGLPRYKMRSDGRSAADNVAVRRAMELQLPLIWLVGVAPGLFQAIFPVYVIGEEPAFSQFVLAYDPAQEVPTLGTVVEQAMRRYILRETRQRLHQPVFRSMVLRAYETRCAICALGHAQLLDAAHIVPDRHEAGIPSVPNGLALCKIHHAAYDVGILGISPEYRVAIRDDVLVEIDGPLLEHGLKALHGQPLMALPRRRSERPDPELLRWRFARFRAA